MKQWLIYIIAMLLAPVLQARLEIVQPATDAFVFSGKNRQLEVTFYNPNPAADFYRTIRTRIYQTSSSTLAPIGEAQVWKKLIVLSGQKIIENATFDFPEVRTVTEFQICWLAENTEVGRTTVRVCPTNLLAEISLLASYKPIAVLDPQNQLTPLLKQSNVQFHDFDLNNAFGNSAGELAILGPFNKTDDGLDDLAKAIAKATRPVTVVWIQQLSTRIHSVPNMYFLQKGLVRVAVVDAALVADLSHSALAQINLLRCVKVAQDPEAITRPKQNS